MAPRLKGIDTNITSWDQQSDNHKSLGLHRDLRPFSKRHELFFRVKLPFIIAGILFLLSFAHVGFFEIYSCIILILISIASRRFRKTEDKNKLQWDRPKYLDYDIAVSDYDFSPKDTSDDVNAMISKIRRMRKGEKPGKAIYFLGHEVESGVEVHADDDRIRTHVIIFGTTGSGKTETILSFCVNFLLQSSGFILIDGKGDSLLFAKVFGLMVAFNRTEDLLLLNFMDPVSIRGRMVQKISNTFNFLVECTALQCNEIMGGLLPSEDGGGMWESRAVAGLSSLNSALYYQFEKGYIELDPEVYQSYFDLPTYAKLSQDTTIPKSDRLGMRNVLTSINYKLPTPEDMNPKQPSTTEEQWQYIVMQYTGTFAMLAGDYKHITVAQYPEISIEDVVLRRRVLLALLPSLAKSPNNVKNLGRILISLTRNVASKAIGSSVEGTKQDVIDSKSTSAINSYALVFDEYGIYATAGAEQLPAQVRSLNLVCLFAGQDFQAFKKGDADAAASIFANCTQKACMKLAEPTETFELFNKSAGETYVMKADTYEVSNSIIGRKYKPKEEARVEKAPILDMSDLQRQGPGIATWVRGGDVTRIKHFYADPKIPPRMRLIHQIQVRAPKTPMVIQAQKALDALYKKMLKHQMPDFDAKSLPHNSLAKIIHIQLANIMQMRTRILDEMMRNPPPVMPSETELMIFCLRVQLDHIELVDKQIERATEVSLGLASDMEFDDSPISALMDDQTDTSSLPIKSAGMVLSSFGAGEWDAKEPIPQSQLDKVMEAPSVKGPTPVKPVQAPQTHAQTPSDIPAKLTPDRINEMLEKMQSHARTLQLKASAPKNPDYNPFKVMKLDSFAVQQGIMSLENIVLQQHGVPKDIAELAAKATAQSVVSDIAIKTDISAVSASKRNRTSPSMSGKKTKERIAEVIKAAGGSRES